MASSFKDDDIKNNNDDNKSTKVCQNEDDDTSLESLTTQAKNDPLIPTLERNLKIHFVRQSVPVWAFDMFNVKFAYGNSAAVTAFGNNTLDDFLNTDFTDTSLATVNYSKQLVIENLKTHVPAIRPWTFYPNSSDRKPFQETIRASAIICNDKVCLLVEVMQTNKAQIDCEKQLAFEAFKFSPSLVSLFDKTGTPLLHNLNAKRYYDETLVQKDRAKFIEAFVEPHLFSSVFQSLSVGESRNDPAAKVKSNDLKYHNVSISCLKNPVEGSDMFVVHQVDVTNQIALQRKHSRMKNQKEQNDRLVKIIGKGLGPQLNGIIGLSTTLVDDPTLTGPASVAHVAEMIRNSGSELVKQLSVIRWYTEVDGESCFDDEDEDVISSLRLVIQRTMEDSQSVIASSRKASVLKLVNDIPNNLLAFKANSRLIRMALVCLIDNAIKYTSQGQITVSASQTPLEEDDSGVITTISVSDTGIGIDPEDASRIFTLFESGSSSSERGKVFGTGIGLALVKKIARIFGGDARVLKSSIGDGSTVIFSIYPPKSRRRVEEKVLCKNTTNAVIDSNAERMQRELTQLQEKNAELLESIQRCYEKERRQRQEEEQKKQDDLVELKNSLSSSSSSSEQLMKAQEKIKKLLEVQKTLRRRIKALALLGIPYSDHR